MRAVSMPKPCVAARASPEIFRRIRLKTGSGMKKQILRSLRTTLGYRESINQKGRRSAPELFRLLFRSRSRCFAPIIRLGTGKGDGSGDVADFEAGEAAHRDVLAELAHLGGDQLRDADGLVLDEGLFEQADLFVELFHLAGHDLFDHGRGLSRGC